MFTFCYTWKVLRVRLPLLQLYCAAAIIVILVVFKQLFLWSSLILTLELKISLSTLWIFFRFIDNRKRCVTARSQDYLPIGSHKDKFIFQSRNLLIFFKNFRKRKFRKFPEFWSNLQKFILQNKEFSEHTKVYTRNFFRFCHLQKLHML